MIAYVLKCNDMTMHVVVGSEDLAELRMKNLSYRDWRHHHFGGECPTFPDYKKKYRWHMDEVSAEVVLSS